MDTIDAPNPCPECGQPLSELEGLGPLCFNCGYVTECAPSWEYAEMITGEIAEYGLPPIPVYGMFLPN